jgi:DNA-binding response OmpR family regulator
VKNEAFRKPRVLCVDRNAPLLQVLQISLPHYGFEAVTATDVVDAAFKFKSRHGDFASVLTNHHLPGGTGPELSKLLREVGYKGRIIVMSGLLTESDLALYHDTSISGFIQKPFPIEKLVTMLSAQE